MKTRTAAKVPRGTIVVDGFILTPTEVQFYQQLADDETVEDAASSVLMSKRTCEDRMYRFQNHLGLHTRVSLIAYLLRKKVIK